MTSKLLIMFLVQWRLNKQIDEKDVIKNRFIGVITYSPTNSIGF